MRDLQTAIGEGKRCWATVLRRGGIRIVPAGEVKEDGLLSWTHEGASRWQTVGKVVHERIGTAEHFLGGRE